MAFSYARSRILHRSTVLQKACPSVKQRDKGHIPLRYLAETGPKLVAGSTCRDSSNLLEPADRRPVRSQIPLRRFGDRSEAGRRPFADLPARASLLLAS